VKSAGNGIIQIVLESRMLRQFRMPTGSAIGARTASTRKAINDGKVDEKSEEKTSQGHSEAERRYFGGNSKARYSAPPSWDGKVEQVKELARRVAIKKRKLTEAVEKLVDEGGHHLIDAEGMAGLELRPVNDGMIDEVLQAGLVEDVNVGENE
jgi:hypothetical protein